MQHNSIPLRLLELYSGIGGMRYALEFAGIPFEVVAAVDVNPVVNCIYCHNFGNANHFQRNILSFTSQELDDMKLDIITMSPPCQPFTRVGLKKDVEDARSCSFLHILNVILNLKHKPNYFLLENVKGFEESVAHDILIETLKKCSYNFQEFLLSPHNFGIPNSRLRYYIIAKHSYQFTFPSTNEILTEMPDTTYQWKSTCEKCYDETIDDCVIKHFLGDVSKNCFDEFLVPDHILLKYATVFDIVYENSSRSCCFTKAYGRYSLGTGSIVTSCSVSEVSEVFEGISSVSDENMKLHLLKTLKLRYFTPKEVATLMCFPSTFGIPPSINEKQAYKALGNSLNVFVVSCLMRLLCKN